MINPDRYYVESLTTYDPNDSVAEGHNRHYHEAHRKKAEHDIHMFDERYMTKKMIGRPALEDPSKVR